MLTLSALNTNRWFNLELENTWQDFASSILCGERVLARFCNDGPETCDYSRAQSSAGFN